MPESTREHTFSRAGQPNLKRTFPLTDMPYGLMLALVCAGLPRTVLADLSIVTPESSLLYYVLALAPFALWLAVAVGRPTRKPVMDFLILGVLYGLSLVLVHQLLWDAGGSVGHRSYTSIIAMAIGVGTGLIGSAVAALAGWARRSRGTGRPDRTQPAPDEYGKRGTNRIEW